MGIGSIEKSAPVLEHNRSLDQAGRQAVHEAGVRLFLQDAGCSYRTAGGVTAAGGTRTTARSRQSVSRPPPIGSLAQAGLAGLAQLPVTSVCKRRPLPNDSPTQAGLT